MRVKAIDLLRDVREILSDPENWTGGEYARDAEGRETDPCDKRAVRWCGQGAIYACGEARGMPALRKVLRDEQSSDCDWAQPLMGALDVIAVRLGFRGFMQANDWGGRVTVLRVIDLAIAELESRRAATPGRRASRRRAIARRSRGLVGQGASRTTA